MISSYRNYFESVICCISRWLLRPSRICIPDLLFGYTAWIIFPYSYRNLHIILRYIIQIYCYIHCLCSMYFNIFSFVSVACCIPASYIFNFGYIRVYAYPYQHSVSVACCIPTPCIFCFGYIPVHIPIPRTIWLFIS